MNNRRFTSVGVSHKNDCIISVSFSGHRRLLEEIFAGQIWTNAMHAAACIPINTGLWLQHTTYTRFVIFFFSLCFMYLFMTIRARFGNMRTFAICLHIDMCDESPPNSLEP